MESNFNNNHCAKILRIFSLEVLSEVSIKNGAKNKGGPLCASTEHYIEQNMVVYRTFYIPGHIMCVALKTTFQGIGGLKT